jgi:hypothetical protein
MTDGQHTAPCSDVIELRTRLNELEKDTRQNSADIRLLLEFMAGIKMLMYLSLSGGGLSIITLIVTITDFFRHASP